MKKLVIFIIIVMPVFLMYAISSLGRLIINFRSIPIEAIYFLDDEDEMILRSDFVFEIDVGDVKEISVKILPEIASDKQVKYRFNDNAIAEVAGQGKAATVSGLTEGSSRLIVEDIDSGVRRSVNFIVRPRLDSVEITNVVDKELTMYLDDRKVLQVDINPDSIPNKNIIYTSADRSIATVNTSGEIHAVGLGNTKIRAAAELDPEVYDEITVTVLPDSPFKVDADYPGYNHETNMLAINVPHINIEEILIIDPGLITPSYYIRTEIISGANFATINGNQLTFTAADKPVYLAINYYANTTDARETYRITLWMRYIES